MRWTKMPTFFLKSHLTWEDFYFRGDFFQYVFFRTFFFALIWNFKLYFAHRCVCIEHAKFQCIQWIHQIHVNIKIISEKTTFIALTLPTTTKIRYQNWNTHEITVKRIHDTLISSRRKHAERIECGCSLLIFISITITRSLTHE